jgi:uncharacterized protein (DUF1800 family)
LALALLIPAASYWPALAAADPATQEQALHLVNRLSFGPRPGDVQRVMQMGSDAYIAEQLHPDSLTLPPDLQLQLASLDTLRLSPGRLFDNYGPRQLPRGDKPSPEEIKAQHERAHEVVQQAVQANLLRAVESPRQLQEVMTNFWFNHFNVFAAKGLDGIWVGAYEEQAIRPYALGHFRDLLMATARHPAMLFYLDNWLNTAPGAPGARGKFEGINENYAREVMELHTLGVDGGYSQQDVTTLAHVLTGWGLCPVRGRNAEPGAFCFDPRRHDRGDQMFLGKLLHGGGEDEAQQALDILAASPATARHLSYELAQYFVADEPDPALVVMLATRWQETHGDIAAVMDSLFHSPQFAASRGGKFKTPYEYVVSMLRAGGAEVDDAKPLMGMLNQLGMPVYGCLTPDGYKNTQAAWLNPDAVTLRLGFATAIAAGRVRFRADGDMPVLDAEQLSTTVPGLLQADELKKIHAEPAELQAALILGSPEFQYR